MNRFQSCHDLVILHKLTCHEVRFQSCHDLVIVLKLTQLSLPRSKVLELLSPVVNLSEVDYPMDMDSEAVIPIGYLARVALPWLSCQEAIRSCWLVPV